MEAQDLLKLDYQLCFPLYAAARKVVNLYTPFLKPMGITYTQYLVFLVLWEQDGVTVGDICQRLYLDSGTLTPLLKKMEEHGQIRRIRSHEDERVVKIFLTDEGRAMKARAAALPAQIGACVDLAPEEGQMLYALLYKVLGKKER